MSKVFVRDFANDDVKQTIFSEKLLNLVSGANCGYSNKMFEGCEI